MIRELPDVDSVAVASMGLMRGSGMLRSVAPTGQRGTSTGFLNTSVNVVSEDYFRVLRIRLLAGRGFAQSDAARRDPMPVVVNESFARRFFPGRDPLGRTFGVLSTAEVARPDFQVIGVVKDARYRSLRESNPPTLYQMLDDDSLWAGGFIFHVRSRVDGARLAAPAARILSSIEPDLPFHETQLLLEQVCNSFWNERILSMVAALLGAIALLVSATGIHGIIAYTAERRMREIGIRVALGAGRANIVGLVCGRTLAVVATGIAAGVAGVFALGPRFADLLYGVSPREPVVLGGGALLMLGLAAASSLTATVAALRIQPAAALRLE